MTRPDASAPAAPVLHLEGLRHRWPGSEDDLLRIDRLHLHAGQRLMVCGDSGCGKSTLLSIAAGVLLPREGRVGVAGTDWASLRPGARDRRRADLIGCIFQQFNLLPYLSVLDNVLLACRFSPERARRCGDGGPPARARGLLAALGLAESTWSREAGRLSVGQQQRVAAARALIGRPALVIADEPTSALDHGHRDAFMRLLVDECAKARSALLFVSHDPGLRPHFDAVLDLPARSAEATA
jgi:putative ABC transport system ATP-binding protein